MDDSIGNDCTGFYINNNILEDSEDNVSYKYSISTRSYISENTKDDTITVADTTSVPIVYKQKPADWTMAYIFLVILGFAVIAFTEKITISILNYSITIVKFSLSNLCCESAELV